MVSGPKLILLAAILAYTFDPVCPFNLKTDIDSPLTELTSRPKKASNKKKNFITLRYPCTCRIQSQSTGEVIF